MIRPPRLLAAGLVACCVAAPLGLSAQGNPFDRFAHRVYDQDVGLPETLINSLARTQDGYLWLGTRRGLVRFDGVRFRLYSSDDVPAFRGNLIGTLATDQRNRLWIGTGGGLSVLENGVFRPIEASNGLGSEGVDAVFADRSGSVWVAATSGVYRSEADRFRKVPGPGLVVAGFAQDGRGRIWAGAEEGLAVWKDGRFQLVGGALAEAVTALLTDSTGDLWLGHRGSVRRVTFDAEGAPVAGPAISLAQDGLSPVVGSLVFDRGGRLWIGSPTHGVAIWDGQNLTRFGVEQALSSLEINALLVDPWDRVWVGSGAALDVFQPTAFTTYSYAAGFPRSLIWMVGGTPDDRIIAAAENGGVYRFDRKRLTTLSPPIAPDAGPTPFAIRPNGSVVIAEGRRRIVEIGPSGRTDLTDRINVPGTTIRGVFPHGARGLWFSTDSGVFRWDGRQVESIATLYGLPADAGFRIVSEDSAGTLWLARPGLVRIAQGRVSRYDAAEGLTDPRVVTIKSKGSDLWIGTADSGLFVLRNDRITSFGRIDRRLRSEVLGIEEDNGGSFWLTSSYGLLRIGRRELEAVADGLRATVAIREFDRQDGLPTTEFNGYFQPSIFKDSSGRLWLPSYVGVVRADPSRVVIDSTRPQIHIDRVLVDGRETDPKVERRFAAGVGRVAIEFTATDALFPSRARIQYRLDGVDRDWTDAGVRRVALYGPLAGGHYRFLLRAADGNGQWGPTVASTDFEVALRVHEQRWFLPVLGLAVLGVSAAIYGLRIRRVRVRAEELASLVDERTRDLQAARANLERRVEERTSQLAEELAERKRLQHQLLQAQKLESIGRLAGGVAHEINNMMTGVLGFAEMAEAQAAGHPALKEDLRQITLAGQRVAQITRQLLTFARRQASKRSSVDVGALIESLERFLLRIVGENIELVVSVAPGVPRVNVDASQLEQLIVNLVMNARDAVVEHGSVRIEVRSAVVDAVRQIGSFEILPGDYVIISVIDTGVGIAAEARSRLFEPFYTTKEVNRGAGLGLSVCYGIVSQHAGAIAVESEVGKGSRFDVYLPTGVAIDESISASAEHRVPGGTERILVVEDEHAVREVALRTLQNLGYEVVAAVDGVDALERYRAEPDRFDLILTDVVMPRMGGVDLAQTLREERIDIPLVFMSGYTGRETPWSGSIAALGPILEKPFTRSGLAGAIRRELDRARTPVIGSTD